MTLCDSLEQEKAYLRLQMRQACADTSSYNAAECSEQATQHLFEEPCIHTAHCVALYVSVRHEMATHKCIEALWEKGITTLVPRCDPTKPGYMDFITLRDWAELETGCFGLREAAMSVPAATQIPDVLVMPALAIDAKGHRLGQGGGYYDRFLMQEAWGAVPRIAFVYSFQVIEQIPRLNHDYMVQAIAHEGGVSWLSK